MNLQYQDYNDEIISGDYFNILIIEDTDFMYRFQKDIYLDLLKLSENFVLLENNKKLKFDKVVEWLNSPWQMSLNERKSLNALHKNLAKRLVGVGQDTKIIRKWLEIEDLINEYIVHEDSIYISEDIPPLNKIIALADLRFEDNLEVDLIDRIEDYLLAKVQYSDVRLFILDNFSLLLKYRELVELMEFSKREELYLLLLENSLTTNLRNISNCNMTIIDEDLCWIK